MAFEIPITWTPLNLAWALFVIIMTMPLYRLLKAITEKKTQETKLATIKIRKQTLLEESIGFKDVKEETEDTEDKKKQSGIVKGIMKGLGYNGSR